ncbi:MAG: DUF1223 domain-containing protein, partial [Endozoicomonas sp.]
MHRLTATYLPLMLASLTLPANHSCACTRMSFNAYLLSRTDSVESLISQSKNKENRAILPSGSVEIAIDTTRLLHTAQLKAVKMASPSSSEANAPSTGNNHCWKTQLLAKGKYVIDTMAQHLKAPTVTSPAVLDVHMEPDYMEQEPSSLPQSGNLHAFFQHAPEDAIWMQQETERSIPQATLISKTITLTLPNGEALQRSYTPGLHDGQPPARSRATPTPAPAPFILIHPALQQGGSRLLATELSIKANPKGVTETDTLEKQATVIELYTSQGCSSCPPAEAWLSRWLDKPELWQSVIPLAFHVSYWNYLGWPDIFSDQAYDQRQKRYQTLGYSRSTYTPEFIVNGREWRGWFLRRPV